MSEYDFDVLYLGSGHGAFDGAGPLAASGKKVGVIESDMIGGTCPNYGCNAKITLDTPVVLQRMAERMQGIVSGSITINWSELVAHKQAVIKPLPTNIGSNLKQTGVTIIHGHGKSLIRIASQLLAKLIRPKTWSSLLGAVRITSTSPELN